MRQVNAWITPRVHIAVSVPVKNEQMQEGRHFLSCVRWGKKRQLEMESDLTDCLLLHSQSPGQWSGEKNHWYIFQLHRVLPQLCTEKIPQLPSFSLSPETYSRYPSSHVASPKLLKHHLCLLNYNIDNWIQEYPQRSTTVTPDRKPSSTSEPEKDKYCQCGSDLTPFTRCLMEHTD